MRHLFADPILLPGCPQSYKKQIGAAAVDLFDDGRRVFEIAVLPAHDLQSGKPLDERAARRTVRVRRSAEYKQFQSILCRDTDQLQEKVDTGAARQAPAMEQPRCERDSHTVADPDVSRLQHPAQLRILSRPVDFFRI